MRTASAKINELGGRLKCQEGDTSRVRYYCSTIVGSLQLLYICGVVGSAIQDQIAEGPDRFPGEQNTNS